MSILDATTTCSDRLPLPERTPRINGWKALRVYTSSPSRTTYCQNMLYCAYSFNIPFAYNRSSISVQPQEVPFTVTAWINLYLEHTCPFNFLITILAPLTDSATIVVPKSILNYWFTNEKMFLFKYNLCMSLLQL